MTPIKSTICNWETLASLPRGVMKFTAGPPEPRVPGEPPPHAFVNQVAWTVIFPGNPP